jgi:SP family galactose:H+ symporter-like MFS transporter
MLDSIAFFAISLGPLGWLIITEVFPTRVRGIGS